MRFVLIVALAINFNVFIINSAAAQIISPSANDSILKYDNTLGKLDSTFIYAFYSPSKGSLKAKSLDGNLADFEWYKFIYKTGDPKATLLKIKSELNVKASGVEDLDEGGYLLTIEQNSVIDTFKSWIFIDTLKANTIYNYSNCDVLTLTANVDYRAGYPWYYFGNLDKPIANYINNDFFVEWIANVDIRAGVKGNNDWMKVKNSLETKIYEPAPLKDAIYTAKMTNLFKNTSTIKSSNITSIATYADIEVLRPNDNDIFVVATDLKGEALYRVKFNSKSINADEFTWKGYGNQLINFEKNKVIWTANIENIVDEVHYRPGKYPVTLSVKRKSTGCTSVTVDDKIKILEVEPSSLDPQSIPNAFTPNGDGQNDYFTFVKGKEPVSLEYFDIKIYNRNGLLVYKYYGSVKGWSGWDGTFMGDKGECSTGVYYYIIKAQGWDDKSYSDKTYTGFLHLFR